MKKGQQKKKLNLGKTRIIKLGKLNTIQGGNGFEMLSPDTKTINCDN